MHRIHPINEETCAQFRGWPVLVVLNDGTRHIGLLSGINGGKLILNEEQEAPIATTGKKAASKRTTKKRAQTKQNAQLDAQVNAFGSPYGYNPFFGGRLAFDLAAISLLFLIFV